MKTEVKMMRNALVGIIALSEGKEKLDSEIVLQSFDCNEIFSEVVSKTTRVNEKTLTEEQYKIIKDSYNSIQAECNKILGILK
jgi:hypothetical protein